LAIRHERGASIAADSTAVLTRQSAYATLALGFDREISDMTKASIGRKGRATVVDTHVGQKIRARRMFLGMSLTDVADAAGLAYQQIQKYEKGVNRVGASRLQQISDMLSISPSYFFEGAPTVGKKTLAPKGELSESAIVSFLATREGIALVRGFLAIKDKPIRQNLIEFIASLKTK
jgi:transcriptional regulator with XRE-family HTH domain